MKKNTFMQGAFIATMGIVLSKILGIIYVIPFYAIIGSKGGALYGYAYNIYSLFLGISSAGIPLAISKIISEYNTLGYYSAKERAFKIGKKTLNTMGILCFLILFIFAPAISHLIIGNVTGGNSPEDVTFVIRVISTAILVVPILSIYRGYLQGHKYITPTSISQVLEQIVRVVIIVAGSFLSLKVFKLSLKTTVGVSVFAATAGALISYFYLFRKVIKNKTELQKKSKSIEEPIITDKEIFKKIIFYALPFIMIDVFKSLYNSVDIITLVKTLVNGLEYKTAFAESIMSVISTWGLKLNMIVIAITTGVMVSLIPNLTSSFVNNDMVDVRRKINKTLQMLCYIVIPMIVGLSILAKPVWTIFYGANAAVSYGTQAYQYYVFVAFAVTMFTSTITIVQVLKEYKMVFISLISGLLFKIIFNIPFIYGFNRLGLPAYYGAITATICGYFVSAGISLVFLNKKFKVKYEETVKKLINILISVLIMAAVLLLLKIFIPFTIKSRLINILIVGLYAIIGAVTYLFLTIKNKTFTSIFGDNLLKKLNKKKK